MTGAVRRDRLERLTNLVLALLDTPRPLSLRQITEEVDGYPAGKEPARQAFERDKRALRDLGIPVTNVPLEGDEQVGYLIKPSDYYLPELKLDEAEANALAFAVAAVQLGDAGRDALSALGHGGVARRDVPLAVLPETPGLGPVHEALKARALLEFDYHGRRRQIEPYGLIFRQAAWYLVGWDRTAGAGGLRTFRVDRFESEPVVGEPAAYELPREIDLRSEINLLPFGSEPGERVPVAELLVDPRLSRQVASIVPRGAVTELGDKSVLVKVPVGDERAFVSWVLGLGDTAVVIGPESLRSAVVRRLEEIEADTSGARPAEEETPDRASTARGRGGRPEALASAGERLRRLLAILVHLSRVKEASISELAERFEMDEAELVHELELASCCGTPPYTPDQLIDLIVDGDRVSAYAIEHLAKPRRLTPEEGFALAAAAKALTEVAGAGDEGALRSALAKLEAVLGESHFSMDVGQPEHLRQLQRAVEEHERVEIEYFSSAATAPSQRQVDPYQVVLREGRWYMDGWCHLVEDLRRFSIDRVQAVSATGQSFEPPSRLDGALAEPGAFRPGPGTVIARVAVPADSAFALEQVALGPLVPLPDGRLVAEVAVGDSEGWFGRLLLRLGPGCSVLSPPALASAPARAARRALEAYRR